MGLTSHELGRKSREKDRVWLCPSLHTPGPVMASSQGDRKDFIPISSPVCTVTAAADLWFKLIVLVN